MTFPSNFHRSLIQVMVDDLLSLFRNRTAYVDFTYFKKEYAMVGNQRKTYVSQYKIDYVHSINEFDL